MKKVCMMLVASLSISFMAGCGNSDSKEERKTKDGKTIVEVTTLMDTRFLKYAEKLYEQKNPNIDIQVQSAYPEGPPKKKMSIKESEILHEKMINKMNTELLAGKGSDVIVLDSLPQEKYVKKGLLTDLSEMMEQDKSFDKNQYFNNILDNSKINGKLYGIPAYFWLSGLLGNDTAIQQSGVKINDKEWTWSEFTSIGKELVNKGPLKHVMNGIEPEYMLKLLVQDHYAELVDKASGKANFQSDLFVQMLENVKKMYDEKIITEDGLPVKETYFSPMQIMSVKNYFNFGNRLDMTGAKTYQSPHIAGQKRGIAFTPETTVGINAKSPVKKQAWDFLKFLISEEIQKKWCDYSDDISSRVPSNFPIHKAVYEQQIKALKEKGKIEDPDDDINVTENDIQELEKMVAEISVQASKGTKVESIIAEESKSYFSGQKSAKDVAVLIQNRVTTYINE